MIEWFGLNSYVSFCSGKIYRLRNKHSWIAGMGISLPTCNEETNFGFTKCQFFVKVIAALWVTIRASTTVETPFIICKSHLVSFSWNLLMAVRYIADSLNFLSVYITLGIGALFLIYIYIYLRTNLGTI